MTSILGESISEPESLDLDYDMWQGQFEIIGQTSASDRKNDNLETSDDTNLNLVFQHFDPSKTPILIDEETFLSLHPNDFIDAGADDSYIDRDGPHSGLFIENLDGFDRSKKCKKIDNFFNANLQKQKIFLMNSKKSGDNFSSVVDTNRMPPPTSTIQPEIKDSSNDSSCGEEPVDKDSASEKCANRIALKHDTLNEQVRSQGV